VGSWRSPGRWLLVACGGGSARLSKRAYEARLQAIGSRMAKATQAAYAPLTAQLSKKKNPEKSSSQGLSVTCEAQAGTLPRGQSKRIERLLASACGRAASEMAALKPPSDAAADNQKPAAGLRATVGLFAASLKLPAKLPARSDVATDFYQACHRMK
jgi:hypothetical protein